MEQPANAAEIAVQAVFAVHCPAYSSDSAFTNSTQRKLFIS
mgnify:CR=1 FL=1